MACFAKQASFSGMWPWPFLAAAERNAILMRLPLTMGKSINGRCQIIGDEDSHMQNTKETSNILCHPKFLPERLFYTSGRLALYPKPGVNGQCYFCTAPETSCFKTEAWLSPWPSSNPDFRFTSWNFENKTQRRVPSHLLASVFQRADQ